MSRIRIDIERVLQEKGISKTQLCYTCRLQRVVRIDLHTLAKICDFLDCDVNEILKLEKDDKE